MRTTLNTLRKMAEDGQKIAVLTCYDASFAVMLENSGVDVLLVGDSLGMVIQGRDSTLSVTMDEMVYHTACVSRASAQSFIVADMPFGSYQESPIQAFNNAVRLMAAGAHMVKVEGGQVMADTVAFLTSRGIPVCGHLGLQPQSVNQLGGYRVQGRGEAEAQQLLEDAVALERAGAGLLVLEAIPASLGRQVTESLSVPTIGIGAGIHCDGQVLVIYDMLGIYPGNTPKFARNFMEEGGGIQVAIERYVRAVKDQTFPGEEHSF